MSFRIAKKQAKLSPHKQHKLGAVIVKGNRVLATGFNEYRPSKLIGTQTLHAEASAILKLLKERKFNLLAGSDLYVTRYTRGGVIGLAKPCAACMGLIKSVGINNVYYSTNNSSEDSGVIKL